ncbi:phage major capsid protein [Nocardioides immobilis]|uniref:Phage major capsid protein n=2 Tax=Nocardioides immobilis TaxID=2049295 RepID=A0A417XYM4_9ACTN|nr:phage major capsid protein [Nocardioides immobilis]
MPALARGIPDRTHTPMTTMTLGQVSARMIELGDEMEKLDNIRQEHGSLTREKQARLDGLLAEFKDLQDRYHEKRSAELAELRDIANGKDGGMVVPGVPGRDDDPFAQAPTRARRIIDQAHRSGALADHAAETVERMVTGGSDFERSAASRWVEVTGDPAYLRAFAHLLTDPTRGHLMWNEQEREAFQRVERYRSESRAMSLTDANGGYMVPMTLDPAINLTSAGSTNPLRQVARVVQTATESWTGITSAGATAEWKAEAAEAADAAPTVDDQPIPVHFGDVFVPYSYEVGMDAANFSAELGKVLADAADQLMNTAYTTGSGTGQPKGFVTALAGTASEINAAADDTFAAGDVYNLQNQLPARFQPNATWQAALPILNLIRQFETTAGALKFPELANGQLLGRAINENSNMDSTVTTTGAVSNFVLAYGDWKQFVIVDRIGTTLELLPNLVGTNRRPTAQRGAFLWFRTGSDVLVTNAFRLLDVASAA